MVHVVERPHGSAIFVKASYAIESLAISEVDDIEVLTTELNNVIVTSVYKPPAVEFKFPQCILQVHGKLQIIIGDFNSHSTQWGYKETNKDGDAVEQWIDNYQLSHIHDTKLPPSFHSARWRSGYNPDLAIATSDIANLCQKIVTDPIPSTQHRPIGLQVHAAVRPTSVPFKRRFNFQKAKWEDFAYELESKIEQISPVPDTYHLFVELVKKTARRHIPRGCRVQYIPGLSEESSKLYDYVAKFEEAPFATTTTEMGAKLMESIAEARRKTWQTLIETTDMTKHSNKACRTIRKLLGNPRAPPQQPKVTVNHVANQLLPNGKSGKAKDKTNLTVECTAF